MEYVLPILDKIDIGFTTGGKGAQLYTNNGVYIDMFCDNGVVSLGYDYYNIEFAHYPNAYKDNFREKAAKKLCTKTGCDMRYAFFANSGTEAVETMMKFARKYQHPDRKDIYFLDGSFHGRTYGTMSADFSGKSYHKEGYGPFLPGVKRFKDIDIKPSAAAVIVTPARLYDGYERFENGWLKRLNNYCHKHGILLGFDEVQTYIRLGKWWGHQIYNDNIKPDMIAVAKGVAGGKPASACLVKKEIGDSIAKGGHFNTFGGNRTAMKGIIDTHNKGKELMEKVVEDGKYIKSELEGKVENLKGDGLMWAFDVENPIEFRDKCLENHVILGVFSNNQSIKLTPPLTISQEALEYAMEVFIKCL